MSNSFRCLVTFFICQACTLHGSFVLLNDSVELQTKGVLENLSSDQSVKCNLNFVENISPLYIPSGFDMLDSESLFESYIRLIESAVESIDFLFMYSRQCVVEGEDSWVGNIAHKAVLKALDRGVKVRWVAEHVFNSTKELKVYSNGGAEIRVANWSRLGLSGIMHTKMILVDSQEFYLGSGNWGSSSFGAVKELGIVSNGSRNDNCNIFVEDLQKIFEPIWLAAEP
eukprot:Awhi_evm1s14575